MLQVVKFKGQAFYLGIGLKIDIITINSRGGLNEIFSVQGMELWPAPTAVAVADAKQGYGPVPPAALPLPLYQLVISELEKLVPSGLIALMSTWSTSMSSIKNAHLLEAVGDEKVILH